MFAEFCRVDADADDARADDARAATLPGAPHAVPPGPPAECAECGGRSVVLDDGNYVCRECNTILERFLDHSAEWRYYGHDDSRQTDPARCGPPANDLFPAVGSVLTTTGAMRGSLSSRMIRKYQVWNSMTYRERALYRVCDLMSVSAARNSIPAVILEEAKSMYKRISEQRISRGENRSAIIASCVYMACKTNGVPRSIREVADMFNVRIHCMAKACKTFHEVLHVDVVCSTPLDFVNRFCSKLSLTERFIRACRHVVKRATELDVVAEFTPPSAVAGCIMLTSDLLECGLDKQRVAGVCQISVMTLSKCYRRTLLFPQLADGVPR